MKMNYFENLEIGKFLKHNLSSENFTNIASLTSNMQGATSSDLVFYNIFNNLEAIDVFLKRLEKSSPGLIVTTLYVEELEKYNYAVVDPEEFLNTQKLLADMIYKFDKSKLKLIGVTGTNGKTSVVNLCTQIAHQNNINAFSIGTIGVVNWKGDQIYKTDATTPSYIELRKILNQLSSKYSICFMEISSHALEQDRLFDLRLDGAGWTSFSRDHLDYHGSMNDYFQSKMKILNHYLKKDKFLRIPRSKSDLLKKISEENVNVLETNKIENHLPLGFRVQYNLDNLEVAAALCLDCFKAKIDYSIIDLPKGRFSIIEFKENYIIIDYAHTPDAIDNICSAIKHTFPAYSLSVIFGCGGDRDIGKRAEMARATLPYADKIIVTSDNPRFEDPEKIIDNIVQGIPKEKQFIREVNRDAAINQTLKDIKTPEIVLIAGKGHEEYQEIKGVKENFSDFDIVHLFIESERGK